MSNRFTDSKKIHTHNLTPVGAGGSVTSDWFSCEGFSYLNLNLANAAAVSSSARVHFSFDKVTISGLESIMAASTEQYRTASTRVKAPYFRIYAKNEDAAQRVMDVWAYLND